MAKTSIYTIHMKRSRKIEKAFIIILLITISNTCFANAKISDSDHIIKPLVGKRVKLEGIAWGAFAKGLGKHIVLSSGDKIYLSGTKYLKKYPQGKLTCIIGILSIKKVEPASQYEQGYETGFYYYSLDVESFDIINTVTNEFPTELMSP